VLFDPSPSSFIPLNVQHGDYLALTDDGNFHIVLSYSIVDGMCAGDYAFRCVGCNKVVRLIDGKVFEWPDDGSMQTYDTLAEANAHIGYPVPSEANGLKPPSNVAYIGYLVPSGFVALPGSDSAVKAEHLAHPEKFLPLYFLQSDLDKLAGLGLFEGLKVTDAPVVFAPYTPLQVTPSLLDPSPVFWKECLSEAAPDYSPATLADIAGPPLDPALESNPSVPPEEPPKKTSILAAVQAKAKQKKTP